MQPEVRLKYRDRYTGKEEISGTMPLLRAKHYRDSGWYPEAVIVLDEEGWPEWEETQQLKMF